MNNKKIRKEVIRRAEELHFNPEKQSSFRKNRRSILTALNNVLVTDISRQMRLLLRINNKDTQECYDRIVI